ncbi:hypothetical protein [Amaricoccus solimangrovi]|uniref:Uncharacterized protein n=1 Tax=Amaricoccus solimangrovi TaxID=2589815 RepID=A0A501WX40_9RHOB|nr:hypothetical protein [Amaricoccus solimangrovi]TPE53282.1 hypothetical protein FJM51_04490 [Amaricoccus solimangrovi]
MEPVWFWSDVKVKTSARVMRGALGTPTIRNLSGSASQGAARPLSAILSIEIGAFFARDAALVRTFGQDHD